MRPVTGLLVLLCLSLGGITVQSAPLSLTDACRLIELAVQSENARFSQSVGQESATVTLRPSNRNWRVAVMDIKDAADRPLMQMRLLPPCTPVEARMLRRDEAGKVVRIEVLAPDLENIISVEELDPPLPGVIATQHRSGTALLAHVDTGVNYLLQDLWPHVAADADGVLIGYDFWDQDRRPYDIDPRRSPFFPLHHGTTVFSVLAREAPDAGIAIYRFPAEEMCRFSDLIAHMAEHGVRIVNMSMGSSNPADWQCFEVAAARNPQMLFVISAGNDGRDIDRRPVYPAALTLENILVVTSSDDFGRLGRGSNVGAKSVDIMVPAERVEVIDHRGSRAETGGTSYAAPRVAALATRFLMANPKAGTDDIRTFIISRTIPAPGAALVHGWIPDPTDDFGF